MWYPCPPLNSNCQICPDQIDGSLVWAMTPGWLITNRDGTRLKLAREWNLEVSSSGLAKSSRGCHMWALNTALPTPHRAAVLLGLGGPHSNHHCHLCSHVLLNPLVGIIKYFQLSCLVIEFLDALASLDLKLSVSEWVTFFGFSVNSIITGNTSDAI